MPRTFFLIAFLLLPALLPAEGPMQVFVSILPQKHFAERLGGERLAVDVMVEPGASPATYEPSPRQMARLSKARLYFAIGVPFENQWLGRIASANTGMPIVDCARGIEKRQMAAHSHGHDHGHGHDHDGGGGIRDPHVWLSPPLALLQARAMLEALCVADPEGAAFYRENYGILAAEIVALDTELLALFADVERRVFLVYHPAWGYFAEAYGLEQRTVEVEGKEPKPAQLAGLIDEARESGIGVVFVQPQFPRQSAELLANEIGARVVRADPLAEDWADNLRRVARDFKESLR